MKLIEITVEKFRNIINSTPVLIEDDITCFVGKNEAGKSSFLHALYRLNPARNNATYIVEDHYPAWLEKKDRLRGVNLDEHKPISAKFHMLDNEVKSVTEKFGDGVLIDKEIVISRTYGGKLYYTIQHDEKKYLSNLLDGLSFTQETRTEIKKANEVSSLLKYLDEYENEHATEIEIESIDELGRRLENQIGDSDGLSQALFGYVEDFIPKFIYFDKYSTLPYTVKIEEILKTDESQLNDKQLTARSLLRMAAADDDYLLNPDYERRKRELENVANFLTQDVLKYWSQNQALRVHPDIEKTTISLTNGQSAVIDELKIRIWDDKHFLSLPFNEHSTGFQWFFSFLAAFSEFEYKEEPYIILLDEPGLGLHGKAQADFLRFIEERLALNRQVLYTTHSPFMIQPDKLNRARVVEERDLEEGSIVSQDIMTTDRDTLFPLQGALGYDLAQHLFISKNNLIVEGTSDFTYLSLMSDFLKDQNRTGLIEDWTLIPVGGADLIPTFVALLGIHLDITVVIDARREGNQKLSNLADRGYLKSQRIIHIGEITGTRLADIEDLFSAEDYIKLYNEAFNKSHKISELIGSDQIVNKIARLEKVTRFNHGKPADFFLRNRDRYLSNLDALTLDNFENLFKKINSTFET